MNSTKPRITPFQRDILETLNRGELALTVSRDSNKVAGNLKRLEDHGLIEPGRASTGRYVLTFLGLEALGLPADAVLVEESTQDMLAKGSAYIGTVLGEAKFRETLYAEAGVQNNPKRDRLWAKAWDLGHSCGYSDIKSYFIDLVELIK